LLRHQHQRVVVGHAVSRELPGRTYSTDR